MIRYYRYRHVLELGTSLGVNTMYLAQDNTNTFTMEGAHDLARLAQQSFTDNGLDNITMIQGNIDETLPDFLQKVDPLDFVFLDANHRYDPTIRYAGWLIPKMANKSAIVFDDIHRSKEMERAWDEVKEHKRINCTVDLFRCGIAFIDTALSKQHVVLQY
jgi:predicted O-methyltransferase YrrM